jgi:hypothetical protein
MENGNLEAFLHTREHGADKHEGPVHLPSYPAIGLRRFAVLRKPAEFLQSDPLLEGPFPVSTFTLRVLLFNDIPGLDFQLLLQATPRGPSFDTNCYPKA